MSVRVGIQILGVALLVLGGQAAIRVFLDPDDGGFLAGLVSGSTGQLLAYVVITVVGVVLAGWATRRKDRA